MRGDTALRLKMPSEGGAAGIYLNIQNAVPPQQLLKIDFFSQPQIATLAIPQRQRIQITRNSRKLLLIVCLSVIFNLDHYRYDIVLLL